MKTARTLIALFLAILILIPICLFSYLYFLPPQYSENGLHPKVKQAKNQLIQNCLERGISIHITSGFRSFSKQDQLYAQGRTSAGSIVTYAQAGMSYHNYGLAIDFALYDQKNQKLSWDLEKDGNQNGEADWLEVVEEAKKLGFSWGGDWEGFKDYPHLEMIFDQSIWELLLKRKLKEYLDSL